MPELNKVPEPEDKTECSELETTLCERATVPDKPDRLEEEDKTEPATLDMAEEAKKELDTAPRNMIK